MNTNDPTRKSSGTLAWLWRHTSGLIAVLLIVAAFIIGLSFGGDSGGSDTPTAAESSTTWTCSMHPQIRQPKPGKCPICAMDLIPLSDSNAAGHPRQLTVSPEAAALMNVQVTPVQRKYVDANVRLFGKVAYDETRLSLITAWVGGRLDRMFVDYTGTRVRAGDHLVEIYSPELLVAQTELIRATEGLSRADASTNEAVRRNAHVLVDAAREKLRLLGLKPQQIEQIAESKKPSDRLTIYTPDDGIVIDKHAKEGMYVQTGMPIYTIADLDRVWVMLDAYESDLQWLRFAQSVEFTTEAYPGETFRGQIAFISPVLGEGQRTVSIRVNADNSDGRLKPGMFVRAAVHSQIAAGGRVIDPALAGKWISPMHPEIVKDAPGVCDICGMKLVRAEDLGYVVAKPGAEPLIVPESAVLRTGERAVVYVKLPPPEDDGKNTDASASGPTFEGRDVLLGPKAGDHYIVRGGLAVGDLVVTRGNFKIDAALQIQARPSMMNPGDLEAITLDKPPIKVPDTFIETMRIVLDRYFQVAAALADDDVKAAAEHARSLPPGVAKLSSDDATVADDVQRLGDASQGLVTAADKDIAAMRTALKPTTEILAEMVKRYGGGKLGPVYVVHCPMAFKNQGADWLSPESRVLNPYFGDRMLKCGEVKRELSKPAEAPAPTKKGHNHDH